MKAALVRLSDNSIHERFVLDPERPKRITVPGGLTISPAYLGWTSPNGVWKIMALEEHPPRPGKAFSPREIERSVSGDTLTLTYLWTPPSEAELTSRTEADADRKVLDRLPKILFALARETRPELTLKQFRAWVEGLE